MSWSSSWMSRKQLRRSDWAGPKFQRQAVILRLVQARPGRADLRIAGSLFVPRELLCRHRGRDVASPYVEGIAFVMKRGRTVRPRFGPAIANLSAHSTAGPSRWTHLVGVTGRARDKTPPPGNAIGLSSPVGGCVERCDGRAKPVAFRPPPSFVPKAGLRHRGRRRAAPSFRTLLRAPEQAWRWIVGTLGTTSTRTAASSTRPPRHPRPSRLKGGVATSPAPRARENPCAPTPSTSRPIRRPTASTAPRASSSSRTASPGRPPCSRRSGCSCTGCGGRCSATWSSAGRSSSCS